MRDLFDFNWLERDGKDDPNGPSWFETDIWAKWVRDTRPLAQRLDALHTSLQEVIDRHADELADARNAITHECYVIRNGLHDSGLDSRDYLRACAVLGIDPSPASEIPNLRARLNRSISDE